jgi:hypothetical protein
VAALPLPLMPPRGAGMDSSPLMAVPLALRFDQLLNSSGDEDSPGPVVNLRLAVVKQGTQSE